MAEKPDNSDVELSTRERARYSRHLLLPELGEAGQLRLKSSRVLVIGAGGLGSPAAMYLVAAGVGHLGLVDFDRVDESNLQRQILHDSANVGGSKVRSAIQRLNAVNPHVQVEGHEVQLSSRNALEIIKGYDIVLDGTDNFATRYLVNDACVLAGKPNVYGSIFRFEGQASLFYPPDGPCYRCLYPQPPPPGAVPNCAEAGVLGILPGLVGVIQATEAIKWLLKLGDTLIGRLLLYDSLAMRFREVKVRRDPACPLCGTSPTITRLIDYEQFCGGAPTATTLPSMTVHELKGRLDAVNPPAILDVREPHEHAICRLPNAKLIPLGQLASRLGELDPSRELIVHCKMGGRSAQAVKLLQERGFANVRNLTGGIAEWAKEVDPSMPRY